MRGFRERAYPLAAPASGSGEGEGGGGWRWSRSGAARLADPIDGFGRGEGRRREENGRVCVRSYGGPLLVLMVAALGFGEDRAENGEKGENGRGWGRISVPAGRGGRIGEM
jgi:hypothetical protein